jgi:hypothetical protein
MAAPPNRSLFAKIFGGFIRKVLAGCMIALPLVITIVALYYVYIFLEQWIMTPLAEAVTGALNRGLLGKPIGELPAWWSRLAAPIIGASVILLALYFLGWLLPTRVYRLMDGTMMRIPLVKPIYQAVRNIFDYVIHPGQPDVGKNQRVVIVPFPPPSGDALPRAGYQDIEGHAYRGEDPVRLGADGRHASLGFHPADPRGGRHRFRALAAGSDAGDPLLGDHLPRSAQLPAPRGARGRPGGLTWTFGFWDVFRVNFTSLGGRGGEDDDRIGCQAPRAAGMGEFGGGEEGDCPKCNSYARFRSLIGRRET